MQAGLIMASREAVCGRRPLWWLADSARRGDTLCRIRGPWRTRLAHLSPSQRLLDDWAGARIVGLPLACACC